MAPLGSRRIVSRRTRPAKSPLSQEAIVSTALDLLSCEGMAGLSLRKVAAALDTGAASLYVYVANLDELHALVLDRALGEVALPSDGDWRERLKAMLHSYFQVLLDRPGLAQVALSTNPSGPNMVELTESILDLLLEGEIEPHRAAWAGDLLVLHTSAFAAERDNRRDDNEVAPRRAQEALGSGEQSRYDWALDVLVNGVLSTPRT